MVQRGDSDRAEDGAALQETGRTTKEERCDGMKPEKRRKEENSPRQQLREDQRNMLLDCCLLSIITLVR